ncbi:MAG: hypothetical protein JXP34_07060 [Planctomycetes bacterium]|nr:hypothetical protein [Planctomycetota bacterium]
MRGLYKKWGTIAFPLAEPFQARILRFRYHDGGKKATIIRMPSAIHIYDGVEDESLDLPDVGPAVARGRVVAEVPACTISSSASASGGCGSRT